MSAEILPFRTKKLTGFLPEESKQAEKDEDTAPAEYVSPESDPA